MKSSERLYTRSGENKTERTLDVFLQHIPEKLQEVIKTNEFTYKSEQYISKLRSIFKAGLLGAVLSLSSTAASGERTLSPGIAESPIISTDSQRETAIFLKKYFRNPESIIQSGGGIVQFDVRQTHDGAPAILHIGNAHGTLTMSYEERRDTMASQRLVGPLLVELIDRNTSETPLPIGLEFITPERKQLAREEWLLLCIQMKMLLTINNRESETIEPTDEVDKVNIADVFFHFPNEEMESFPELLHIIKHYQPNASGPIFDYLKEAELPSSFSEEEFMRISSLALNLLTDIEQEENFYFFSADTSLEGQEEDSDYSLRLKHLAEEIKRLKEEHRNLSAKEVQSEDVDKSLSRIAKESFDLLVRLEFVDFFEQFERIFYKREQEAFDRIVGHINQREHPVAVLIFGSSHDFRNEAYAAGFNHIRFETFCKVVHEKRIDYDSEYSLIFSNPIEFHTFFSGGGSGNGQNILFRAWAEEWVKEVDPETIIADLIGMRDFSFIIRHFNSLRDVFGLSDKTLVSVTRQAVEQGYGYLLAEHESVLREHLSSDQIASVMEFLPHSKRNQEQNL